METKEQIIERRVGGLGSSDAKVVADIAKNGKIEMSNLRIAQMLGQAERMQFSTNETQLGDAIESAIYETIKTEYPNVESNPYYRSERLSEKYGFDVFNHIDYEVEKEDTLIWIENKASKKKTTDVLVHYREQLQWHWMLLEEKAAALNKKPVLFLSHYFTGGLSSEFNADNLFIVKVKKVENNFEKGLQIIADALPTFQYAPGDVVNVDEITDETVAPVFTSMSDVLTAMKKLDSEMKDFKEIVRCYMESNGIKSIKSEGEYSITYVPESVSLTFDQTRFKAEHPEIADAYMKKSTKKPFVTIKTI